MLTKFKIKGMVSLPQGCELPSENASRVLILNSNKELKASSVTTTTLGYLDATSSVQTQLNNKSNVGHTHVVSDITNYVAPYRLYNASGIVSSQVKMWVGSTTVSSGNWSINYANAGFTTVFGVFSQAQATGTDAANANYSSVLESTITTTGCSGRASNAVTVGLLLAYVNQAAANGLIIKVMVIGI